MVRIELVLGQRLKERIQLVWETEHGAIVTEAHNGFV